MYHVCINRQMNFSTTYYKVHDLLGRQQGPGVKRLPPMPYSYNIITGKRNSTQTNYNAQAGWGGGTPYNGLHGEAPPERGTFFRLQVYKRVQISQVEV